MKEKYNVIFQDSQLLMILLAEDNKEARKIFNKQISIKLRRVGK